MDPGIIVVVVLVFILIWVYSRKAKREKKTNHKNDIPDGYDRLEGYERDKAVEVINQIEQKEQKNELDHYRLGELKMFNIGDVEAVENYEHALNLIQHRQIANLNVDDDDTYNMQMFIADRIRDNARMLANRPLEQRANFVAGQIPVKLNSSTWISDSQNVHDSTLNAEVKEQYLKMVEQNGEIDVAQNMREIYKWAETRQDCDKINAALYAMNRGATSPSLSGDNETLLLAHAWERIKHSKNAEEIKGALGQQLADAELVCLDGRIGRVISSFAIFDPEIGVVKNKETYRHEMMDQMGVIVRKAVENASPEVQKDYNTNKNTDETKALQEEIKEKLEKKAEEYKDKLPKEQWQGLLDAAKDSV